MPVQSFFIYRQRLKNRHFGDNSTHLATMTSAAASNSGLSSIHQPHTAS